MAETGLKEKAKTKRRVIDIDVAKAMINEAAKQGAREALAELGIKNDEQAQRFRKTFYFAGTLMDATNDTTKTIRRLFVKVVFISALTLLGWGFIAVVNAIKDGTINQVKHLF